MPTLRCNHNTATRRRCRPDGANTTQRHADGVDLTVQTQHSDTPTVSTWRCNHNTATRRRCRPDGANTTQRHAVGVDLTVQSQHSHTPTVSTWRCKHNTATRRRCPKDTNFDLGKTCPHLVPGAPEAVGWESERLQASAQTDGKAAYACVQGSARLMAMLYMRVCRDLHRLIDGQAMQDWWSGCICVCANISPRLMARLFMTDG